MSVRVIQVAAMFFLKYYVLGAVYTTMALVLAAHGLGSSIGIAYSIGGFSAIFASMLLEEIADRHILPNHLLFICHIVSAVALFFMPGQVVSGHALGFLALLSVYVSFGDANILVCIRIAFTRSTTRFNPTPLRGRSAPAGFLYAGLVTGFNGLSSSVATFQIAAAASVLLAIYALTLHERRRRGRAVISRNLFGWDVFTLLREGSFRVFLALAIAIFFPMSAYNAFLPVSLKDNGLTNVGGLMTLAQMTEIGLMFYLAYLIRRLGIRYILAVACLGSSFSPHSRSEIDSPCRSSSSES